MSPQVSVVIPNWNGLSLLKDGLKETVKLKGVSEWVLADDSSTDGSTSWVKESFPQINVVSTEKNLGFPKNVNNSVARTSGEFVAIINHDLIPHPDAILKATSHFKDDKVVGVTFAETGEKGWGICRWESGWIETPYVSGDTDKPHETFWGSGGETIYRRSAWEELHGYDEIFSPGYWEDIDFGYRARKRGWKLIWDPEAIVQSSQRGTSFKKRYDQSKLVRIKERNRLLLIWKNITSQKMFRQHEMAVVRRTLSHPGYLIAVLAALVHLPEIKKKREIERREATISDEEVFQKFSIS